MNAKIIKNNKKMTTEEKFANDKLIKMKRKAIGKIAPTQASTLFHDMMIFLRYLLMAHYCAPNNKVLYC